MRPRPRCRQSCGRAAVQPPRSGRDLPGRPGGPPGRGPAQALRAAPRADRPGRGVGGVEASGELSAGQGTIGLCLLRAWATEMKFRFAPRLAKLDDRKPDIDSRALGLSFTMTPDGE